MMNLNWKFFIILIIIKYCIGNSITTELQRHYHVNVTPICEQQTMRVILTFNGDDWPNSEFVDWIIVGKSNRPECRLKGNGELQYVIELTVFNDPCQTETPTTGVFQNRIRIGKNPAVILLGDKTFIIKCTYGLPEISQLDIPSINPSFNAVTLPDSLVKNSVQGGSASDHSGIPQLSNETSEEISENLDMNGADDNTLISWPIVLTIIGGFFLIIIILISAFMCFQWKIENEQRNLQRQNTPANGITINKFGISDHWWNDRNHMRSKQLPSIQTTNERSSTTVQSTIRMNASPLSSDSSNDSEQNLQNASTQCYSQRQSTTTGDSGIVVTDDLPVSYSEWRSRILANLPNKHLNSNNNVDLNRCSSLRTDDGATVGKNELSEVRSITEIYQCAETALGDTSSQSTLEDPVAERLIRCVGKIRGIGTRKLTEQEFGRWRRLVTSNVTFRQALLKAYDSKGIQEICFGINYRKLFTKEKWNAIIRCISEELQQQQQQQCDLSTKHFVKQNDSQRQDLVASSLNVYIGGVGGTNDW